MTSIYFKNQTKRQKPLEIKWLRALQKTHPDSNSHEQIKKPKITPKKLSQFFSKEQKIDALVLKAPEHCIAL
jgi:hypothetical protein